MHTLEVTVQCWVHKIQLSWVTDNCFSRNNWIFDQFTGEQCMTLMRVLYDRTPCPLSKVNNPQSFTSIHHQLPIFTAVADIQDNNPGNFRILAKGVHNTRVAHVNQKVLKQKWKESLVQFVHETTDCIVIFYLFASICAELRNEIEKLKSMGYTTRGGRRQSEEERKKNEEMEGLKERLAESQQRMVEMEEAWRKRMREEETKRRKLEEAGKEVSLGKECTDCPPKKKDNQTFSINNFQNCEWI